MNVVKKVVLGITVGLLSILPTFSVAFGAADHVRWDIISINFPPTPPSTFRPGGVAFALADADHRIRLTGFGTFVAPASGGISGAATGGGTWETFGPGGVSTGSGTYQVTELVSWHFANFQTGTFIDLIGDANERANGSAVLRIAYSDGNEGTLGVGCHGPGAPAGIQEGVIATKDFMTYWSAQAPLPGVDANRTLFHVRQ
ncbi:MAG TPA: hypothetical protein VGL25_10650 [Casimicrobiaceae bacterium]|jgi:hypothetical protein